MSRLQQYLEMAENDDNKFQLTSSEKQDLIRNLNCL